MKNIIVLDTGKEWGGGTNSLLELLHRIDKKKYNFTALFYYNYPMSEMSDIKTEIEKLGINFILFKRTRQPIYIKILKEIGRALLFLNIRLRKLYIFWIDYFFRIKKDAEGLTKLLNDLSIDVLYMNNQPSTNLEGIIAARDAGVESLLHSRIEADLNSFEIKAVNKWLTKMICVSEGVKGSFVRQGIESSKCIVVHNGIDTGRTPLIPSEKIRQELGVKDNELLIGTVGSLVKRKRFNDLIKVIAYISSQFTPASLREAGRAVHGSQIKCIIVGDGPEREFLQKEIYKYKLNNTVILTGFKSDAISYINSMDIFVLPSEREGFPRVILEAMLMGKPVIASRIAGPAELVIDKETGFLFQTGNIEELADCISTILLTPQLKGEMGGAGRKRVIENFSIEKYVNQVSTVLAEVIG